MGSIETYRGTVEEEFGEFVEEQDDGTTVFKIIRKKVKVRYVKNNELVREATVLLGSTDAFNPNLQDGDQVKQITSGDAVVGADSNWTGGPLTVELQAAGMLSARPLYLHLPA